MAHKFDAFKPDGTPVCSQCGKTEEFLSAEVPAEAPFRPCRNAPLAAPALAGELHKHFIYTCLNINHFVSNLPVSSGTFGVDQQVPESRKRRWDGLNVVLGLNKKAKTRSDGEMSLGYFYAN
jgi:hypothetical protein